MAKNGVNVRWVAVAVGLKVRGVVVVEVGCGGGEKVRLVVGAGVVVVVDVVVVVVVGGGKNGSWLRV